MAVTGADGRRVFVRAEPAAVRRAAPAASPFLGSSSSKRAMAVAPPVRAHRRDARPHRRGEARGGARRVERLDARAKMDPAGSSASAARQRRDGGARRKHRPASAKKRRGESERREKDAPRASGSTRTPPRRSPSSIPENVNREVLHWLKAWDGVVFKRAPEGGARRQVRRARRRRGGRGRPRRVPRAGAAADTPGTPARTRTRTVV